MSNSQYSSFDATLLRESKEGEEIELTVRVFYNYYSGRRGSRDSICGVKNAGPPLEPDAPPEVEIIKTINLENQQIIELTNAEYEDVIEEILDYKDFCFENADLDIY